MDKINLWNKTWVTFHVFFLLGIIRSRFWWLFIFMCGIIVSSITSVLDELGLGCFLAITLLRSSRPEVILVKGVLKIYRKFTGEHPCRNMIPIKVQSNFIEMTLWHGCSHVSLLHIFRTPFPKNISGWLLLIFTGQ